MAKKISNKSTQKKSTKTAIKAVQSSKESMKKTASQSKNINKKSTPKKVIKKQVTQVNRRVEKTVSAPIVQQQAVTRTPKTFSVRQMTIATVILLLAALLYFARGFFFVALVNGQPISRFKLVKQLEKDMGKSYLDNMVTEALIKQEAMKQNIKIEDSEIDVEIVKFEEQFSAQGQTLEAMLELQGMTIEELKDRVRIQKMVEKILVEKSVVTEEDVDQYIEANKEFLPESTDEAQIRADVRLQLSQEKMGMAFNEWYEEAKESARIRYFADWAQEKVQLPAALN
jgi:SurA-like protein